MAEVSRLNGYIIKDKKATRFYETVADMKLDTTLKANMHVKTCGYYVKNDGGNAEYYITDSQSQSEYQESLNNGLYATIILKKHTNVNCFGAYGDETHDDTTAIQNAINYCSNKSTVTFSKKIYLINDILTLENNIYDGNDATFKINFEGERKRESQIINSLFFGDGSNSNKIEINNLNIEDINSPYLQTISVCNCAIILNNVNINKFHAGSTIDLYGGNSNSIINQCKVNINVENLSSLASCILVRGFGYQDTNNVIINKCNLSQNSLDETIWVSSGFRSLKNIKITNNIINDLANSDDTVFIGINRTGSVENVIFSNNIINKTNLVDRCISIARTGNEDKTSIPHKNIIFSNNIINVTESNSQNNRILCYCYSNNDYFELMLSNNEINYLGETSIKSVIEGNVISNNNIIKATNSNYSFQGAYISNNDTITSKNGYKNVSKCNNVIATISDDFIDDSGDPNSCDINGCNITCKYLIKLSGADSSKYNIKNNIINVSETHIINNYNPTNSPTIILIDNIINSTSKAGFIKNSACNLIAKNNFYSTTNNGIGEYKGIPEYSKDRESYIVGSVLVSNTATKSIVRKISTGDQTSNWEEI